jgi:hypothetical protein
LYFTLAGYDVLRIGAAEEAVIAIHRPERFGQPAVQRRTWIWNTTVRGKRCDRSLQLLWLFVYPRALRHRRDHLSGECS